MSTVKEKISQSIKEFTDREELIALKTAENKAKTLEESYAQLHVSEAAYAEVERVLSENGISCTGPSAGAIMTKILEHITLSLLSASQNRELEIIKLMRGKK